MSSLVGVTRKPDSLQGYQLLASADMESALAYISNGNYVGTVQSSKSGSTVVWTLLIQSTIGNTSQTAYINDWIIIKNNTEVSVCPAANFANLYTSP